MDTFVIINKDGTIEEVPMMMVNSSLLNGGLYVFIGTDFAGDRTYKIETGIKTATCECLGKISDQDEHVFPPMLTVLKKLSWDLDQYPDPEIIHITY